MSLIKKCDRCKKDIEEDNELGFALAMANFRLKKGYLRPNELLLKKARESGWEGEYFPVEFEKNNIGEIDLCRGCFDEFMKLKE